MIVVSMSKDDKVFADRIEKISEMSVAINAQKSFNSEELALMQVGATIAAPMITAAVQIFIDMWKEHHKFSIKIGENEFSCSGFTKEETLRLAEKYAPCIDHSQQEEQIIRISINNFLMEDISTEQDGTNH